MICLSDQNLVPISATAQLDALAQLLRQTLDKSFLGLILHGSAALSGFEPGRSDLDVLAIIDGQLTAIQRQGIGKGILQLPINLTRLNSASLRSKAYKAGHILVATSSTTAKTKERHSLMGGLHQRHQLMRTWPCTLQWRELEGLIYWEAILLIDFR